MASPIPLEAPVTTATEPLSGQGDRDGDGDGDCDADGDADADADADDMAARPPDTP
jgi:hypothetical protein